MSDVIDDIASAVSDRLGVGTEINHGDLIVQVEAADRPRALKVLKSLGFTYYSFGAGVDHPDEDVLEMLDHVYDVARRRSVTVKCRVPRAEPRLPTAIEVFAGADWHEREAWEMFGLVFAGHPQLRRLLLPDWQEGFPMRKDYELRARVEKPWPGEFFEA